MKTLTLEEAVTDVIDGFVKLNKTFSAHEVTTAIRNKVNNRDWEISGIAFGYVDAQNTHSQQIQHGDVKSIVHDIANTFQLNRDYTNGYVLYSSGAVPAVVAAPIANTILAPKTSSIPTFADIEARVLRVIDEQMGSSVLTTITGQSNIAAIGMDSLDVVEMIMAFEEEFADILDTEISEQDAEKIRTVADITNYFYNRVKAKNPVAIPPGGTGASSAGIPVPQRFTIHIPQDKKQHVNLYIRDKLAAGVKPTLRQIAKTVRIDINTAKDIALAEGWTVTHSGSLSHSIVG